MDAIFTYGCNIKRATLAVKRTREQALKVEVILLLHYEIRRESMQTFLMFFHF